MDYEKFLTETSKRRTPSELREMGKYLFTTKGPQYFLGGGIPSSKIFIFESATFTMKNGDKIEIGSELMSVAQQYGASEGFLPLRNMVIEYQRKLHNPPSSNWTTILTSGCQEALCNVCDMVLEKNDYVIGGTHMYSGTMDIIRTIGVRYLAVESDELGMRPDSLRKVLSPWDTKFCRENKKESPKMIVLVPNGGNPESATLETERRREIYKIAQEYDLLILEDDPYQFIVFDQEIPPSFLSMDTDGRVLRCDSFSKIIAPGFRLGMLTAAQPFIKNIIKRIQISSQQANCLSQVLLFKLLNKWQFEGFLKNAERCRDEFKKQKDLCVIYVNKWLSDLVEMAKPTGGMFIWIRVKGVKCTETICKKTSAKNVTNFDDGNSKANPCLTITARLVSTAGISYTTGAAFMNIYQAYFAPGKWFTFNRSDSPYIRVSFSYATEDEFENGFRILADVIREEQKPELLAIPNGNA